MWPSHQHATSQGTLNLADKQDHSDAWGWSLLTLSHAIQDEWGIDQWGTKISDLASHYLNPIHHDCQLYRWCPPVYHPATIWVCVKLFWVFPCYFCQIWGQGYSSLGVDDANSSLKSLLGGFCYSGGGPPWFQGTFDLCSKKWWPLLYPKHGDKIFHEDKLHWN
jgi:hypothetical protein